MADIVRDADVWIRRRHAVVLEDRAAPGGTAELPLYHLIATVQSPHPLVLPLDRRSKLLPRLAERPTPGVHLLRPATRRLAIILAVVTLAADPVAALLVGLSLTLALLSHLLPPLRRLRVRLLALVISRAVVVIEAVVVRAADDVLGPRRLVAVVVVVVLVDHRARAPHRLDPLGRQRLLQCDRHLHLAHDLVHARLQCLGLLLLLQSQPPLARRQRADRLLVLADQPAAVLSGAVRVGIALHIPTLLDQLRDLVDLLLDDPHRRRLHAALSVHPARPRDPAVPRAEPPLALRHLLCVPPVALVHLHEARVRLGLLLLRLGKPIRHLRRAAERHVRRAAVHDLLVLLSGHVLQLLDNEVQLRFLVLVPVLLQSSDDVPCVVLHVVRSFVR